MIRVAVAGLGKMGVSHLAMINAHPGAEVVAICDPAGYLVDIIQRYSGIAGYADYAKMIAQADIDAVMIAAPSRLHFSLVKQALDRGLHVFCEKPFCLSVADSEQLTALALAKGLVSQVGYHYRFVGAFREMRRLLAAGAVGEVTHVLAEAHGPVVLRPQGSTWRHQGAEGGGCLYDYAAHPLNLLNWFFGTPTSVAGSVLRRVFSRDVDDEVYSTLMFEGGTTGQLAVSWSDASFRKMNVKISVKGVNGRITADAQELQVHLDQTASPVADYPPGWTVRNVTDLQDPVWFYLRGEEYSAQIDGFVRSIESVDLANLNRFAEATQTDRTIAMIQADAATRTRPGHSPEPAKYRLGRSFGFLGLRREA